MNQLLDLATDEDRTAWRDLRLGYTETQGSQALRTQIAATYSNRSHEDILCFAGAEEGLYVAMKAVLAAGDHAIVLTPNYQSAESVPMAICEVSGLMMRPENSWIPDLAELTGLVRPNTKLISINFPHNPTGTVVPQHWLDQLITLCRLRGIWLFSDEVYRGIERDPACQLVQVADLYERGISLNVMSKAYGLPGLRIGWIACQDRALLAAMNRYKHYLSICNSAPSEQLAKIALNARAPILTRNAGIIKGNLSLLRTFFAEYADFFDWYEPLGGCVAYPRYKGAAGVGAWTERLMERHGVLLLPSYIYDSALTETPQQRFRIGFGRANMGICLDALRAAMAFE